MLYIVFQFLSQIFFFNGFTQTNGFSQWDKIIFRIFFKYLLVKSCKSIFDVSAANCYCTYIFKGCSYGFSGVLFIIYFKNSNFDSSIRNYFVYRISYTGFTCLAFTIRFFKDQYEKRLVSTSYGFITEFIIFQGCPFKQDVFLPAQLALYNQLLTQPLLCVPKKPEKILFDLFLVIGPYCDKNLP